MSNSTPSWLTNLTVPEGCMVFDLSPSGFIPWDNPDNIISQDTEKVVDTVVGAVCLPILFLISVPSNVLNMIVFWRQGLKERINFCLFYLSMVDFCHMLSNFLFNVHRIPLPFHLSTRLGVVTEFMIGHFLTGFIQGFSWLSGFISMVIASERCLCVVSPLRSQTLLKTKTTAVILVMATLIIVPGSMLTGARWSVVCVFDPVANTTYKALYTREFFARNKAHLNALFFFLTTFQLFFYVIVVSATTTVTSVKLKKMVAWREQTSSQTLSSREVALTRMLIAVSVLYVICSTPIIISGILAPFVKETGFSGRHYNFTQVIISVLEMSSFVNGTFNFCVYCFLGSRFRDTLGTLLCCGDVAATSVAKHQQ